MLFAWTSIYIQFVYASNGIKKYIFKKFLEMFKEKLKVLYYVEMKLKVEEGNCYMNSDQH